MCLHLLLQGDTAHYIHCIVFSLCSLLLPDVACSATAVAKTSFYDTFYMSSFLCGKILACNMYWSVLLNFTFKCFPCSFFLLA